MVSLAAIKMLMADVDGTLVTPEKTLTGRARQCALQLVESGYKFTLISSRPPYGLAKLAKALQINEPIVAFNGGLITTPAGKPLHPYRLTSDSIARVLSCFREFEVFARLYTADGWFAESVNQPYMEEEIRTLDTQPNLTQDFLPYFNQTFKLTGVSQDKNALNACREKINALLNGAVSALCSQPYYLDVTHYKANKGEAVKTMALLQHLQPNNIAVIGDMPSDVPMFNAAGLSIAMGNASDDVKRQADYTTDANTADGFAKAVEIIFLKQPIESSSEPSSLQSVSTNR